MLFTALLSLLCSTISSNVIQMEVRSASSLRAFHRLNVKQRSTGSQPLTDYYDNYFVGSLSLGTPPQTFGNILLDTGSSNFWVIDANCHDAYCEGTPSSNYNKTRFDGSKSSTYQPQTTTFNIQYGSDNCRGHFAIDIGGLTYATQQFGVANDVPFAFGERPLDGILGLAWPSLAANNVVPPVQNLLPQLDAPLFTIWLDRKGPQTFGQTAGLITFGAIDTTNCDSNVHYAPLSAETFWQFALDGFSVGTYSDAMKQTAISDTGTPRLGGPMADVDGIMKAIGAQYDPFFQHYDIDCNATASDLVFTINGRQYNIPFANYILDLGLGDSNCVVTVYPVSGGGFGPSWNLGDTFIRTYCNVYDIGNQRIGFALAKHGLL